MWYLKNIPKIMHVYWGGGKLSYLRYLTIESFHYYNPEWEIILYKSTCDHQYIPWHTHEQEYADNYTDFYGSVSGLNITVKEIDFKSIGFTNHASEVHKSDYLRWKLLYEVGGLWSDIDILYIKPMDDICFNKLELSDVNAVFCISGYGHSIGFLLGGIDNDYFKTIHKASLKGYINDSYQCMGSLLCNRTFPNTEFARKGNIVPYNLPMDVVYPYDANHVRELLSIEVPSKITENTIGIHWYGGNPLIGKFLNTTNGGFNAKGNSIIEKIINNKDV
jgi:hypothetical protein